jgi:hypothetical protein
MGRNYINNQCTSVDDLKSIMRLFIFGETSEEKSVQINNLTEAIEAEKEHQDRISIIKILEAKRKAIQKTL